VNLQTDQGVGRVEENVIVFERRLRKLLLAVLVVIGFAGCGAADVDSVIRSGSGDAVIAESAE